MPLPAVAGGLIAAGGSVLGGLFGAGQASADREAAIRAYEQSVADLEAIGIPSVQAQQLVMEEYKSAGQWTPQLEEAIKLGDSRMLGISTDPAYKEAQLGALSKLREIGDSGGMTLSDKAALEKTLGSIDTRERGAREAALQDMAARGQLGSGLELAARLQNAQDASTQAHATGLGVAGQAQARALEAIMQGGQLGSSLREQEFGEKESAAKAQDLINQWNAANTQSVRSRNVGLGNQASQYNLGNTQSLMNANTGLRNEQQQYNKNLLQQRYENEMQKAVAKANARAEQATQLSKNANATAGMWSSIGKNVGDAALAVTAGAKPKSNYAKDLYAGADEEDWKRQGIDRIA